MNDLGTSVEHMDRLYLWRVSKRGHRVHIENPETERAYCQVENCGGKPFDGRGTDIPPDRRLCRNCIDLEGRNETNYQEPSLAVLMGERLAETGLDLFASTRAAKPWKRGKPTRPAHRSKRQCPKLPNGAPAFHLRKPKRSNVKYARPFNDDLPW